ncbi:MAG: 5-oxoprolinase subunit PxpA [Mycobacteriales bacterium]
MTATRVDLNSDVGESYGAWSFGDDLALLDVVTSANVACGFHAGDPRTIERTVAAAAERGVVVGAQVSYPDLVGFGRRDMDVAPADLTADVLYQLGALEGFARVAGTSVRYVKPHGALYNRCVVDDVQARAVVQAVKLYDRALPVLTLPGSALARAARAAGVSVVAEGFADRAYTAAGHLVPRREPGAVVVDEVEVVARAVRMVDQGRVAAHGGGEVEIGVQSLCVHGDTPGAARLARAVREGLEAAGLTLQAFA